MTTLSTAKAAANKMISDAGRKMQRAIWREEWGEAAKMESYISGMRQVLVLFEMVKDEDQEVLDAKDSLY